MTEADRKDLARMDEIFSNNPTVPLFHYTTVAGLSGIVKSKELWATDARFLNDKSELDYLAAHVDRIIDERIQTEPYHRDDLRKLKGSLALWRINHPRAGPIYVCSLSEQGNLLSQWRGYCPNGSGVSIEFDSVELHTAMVPRGVLIIKVSYDLSKLEEVANGVLSYLLYGDVRIAYLGASRIESAIEEFAETLAFLAPAFKHPAFHEEAEWRLIYSKQHSKVFQYVKDKVPSLFPNPFPTLKTQYRAAPGTLIPYVALPLTEGTAPLDIVSVTLGPSTDDDLFEETVKGFLDTTDARVGEVRSSRIPLRLP